MQADANTKLPSNTRMQHDRFAREIVGILAHSDAARSRRLMRRPLGALCPSTFPQKQCILLITTWPWYPANKSRSEHHLGQHLCRSE
jgi:hypothetical protein